MHARKILHKSSFTNDSITGNSICKEANFGINPKRAQGEGIVGWCSEMGWGFSPWGLFAEISGCPSVKLKHTVLKHPSTCT